jgi:hypothetical protein
MREPDALLGRRVEAAILDHANPRVLDGTFSRPRSRARSTMRTRDARRRGARAGRAAPRAQATRLRATSGLGRDYPAARISLRSSTPDAVTVVEEEDGRRARPRRARARVPRRSTTEPCTCTSASRTS